MLGVLCLTGGCFLKNRSPVHAFHPDAEVLVEGAIEASFSPDGKQMAFVRQEGGKAWTADLYVMDLETKEERQITASSDYEGQPSWSPDSQLLLYTARRRGLYNLFLTSVAKGGERQVTLAGGRQGDFSPDGVSILYTSDESGSLDLYLTTPGGGISRQLTQDPGREWFPRYSPDGRFIVFSSNQEGSDDLWLLERGTERRIRLTSDPGDEIQAAWSPDSKYLAYASSLTGNRDGFRLDLHLLALARPGAGSVSVPLTGCDGLLCQSSFPKFAPDGKSLVFSAQFNPLQPRLARIPLKEESLMALTSTP